MPICGGLCGGEFDGEVRNLAAVGTFRGAGFSFVHDGVTEEQRHRYAVTLDGDLVALLQDGETRGRIESIPAGLHRIGVWPLREACRRIPDFHGHAYGRRAYLRWDRGAEADLRSYRVEHLQGATWTAVGTVDIVEASPRWSELPDTGTGTGAVSIGGGWTGDAVNDAFTVEVTGAGTFRHNLRGAWESAPFVQGVPAYLPFGLWIVFESAAGEYDTGDTWAIAVGPRASWASGDLAEGTHQFRVVAIDAAGNESAAGDPVSVVIIHAPGEVTDITATMDDGDIVLGWTLPGDGDLDAVLVYANHSRMFGTLGGLVIETGPWEELAANATGLTFTPPVAGVWRFYVRTRDAAGRLSESIELVEVDTTALPPDVELREPEQVEVTATAGGTFTVSWEYPSDGGGDVTGFLIYRNEDEEEPEFTTPVATVGAAAREATGLGPETGPVFYTVRATNGTVETTNADLHEGVPDDEGPDTPEGVVGVAN